MADVERKQWSRQLYLTVV